MSKIEKSTLFTEITVEQSATVSGGDSSIDAAQALAQQLAALSASGVTVTVSGSSGSGSSAPSAPSAPPAPPKVLPVLLYNSNNVVGF